MNLKGLTPILPVCDQNLFSIFFIGLVVLLFSTDLSGFTLIRWVHRLPLSETDQWGRIAIRKLYILKVFHHIQVRKGSHKTYSLCLQSLLQNAKEWGLPLTEEQVQISSCPHNLGKLWQKSQMSFLVLSPDSNPENAKHFAK